MCVGSNLALVLHGAFGRPRVLAFMGGATRTAPRIGPAKRRPLGIPRYSVRSIRRHFAASVGSAMCPVVQTRRGHIWATPPEGGVANQVPIDRTIRVSRHPLGATIDPDRRRPWHAGAIPESTSRRSRTFQELVLYTALTGSVRSYAMPP